jgi:Ca-activated chloride channel family protein
MKSLMIILFSFYTLTNASIISDYNTYKFNENIQNNDFGKALENFKNIENVDDKTLYNIANIYYKNKQYDKAMQVYMKISDPALEYKKLHNLGNTYANLGQIKKAIESYEDALLIKNDEDTQFNLDLLLEKEKQEKEKQSKQQKKGDDTEKKNRNNQTKENQTENKKIKTKDNQKSQSKEQKKKTEQKKDNVSNNKNDQKKEKLKKQKNEDEKNKQNMKIAKESNLSHLEEKKWENALKEKQIQTLIIPFEREGDKDENVNPW